MDLNTAIVEAIQAQAMQAGAPLITLSPAVFRELLQASHRYAFLREEDEWGEDTASLPVGSPEATCSAWDLLGEASGSRFDAIVDAKIRDPEIVLIVD